MAENINSSRYVIDASYVLSFLLPDEQESKVERAFERFITGSSIFYSSPILPYEVCNSISVAVIRKRIKSHQAVDMVKLFLAWDIRYEAMKFASVVELAIKAHLTVYDASYAWVAKEKHIPLLTLDHQLSTVMKHI